jgi:hypothetical protein
MRRDPLTLDLFASLEPKPVVERFDEPQVRASTLAERMARAVSTALKEFDADRALVATEMSAYLGGETVSKAMLDQYASQTNSATHAIPAHRLIALAIVTGDARLINALLADTGLVAVNAKYEPLIRREMTREAIEKLQRQAHASDAEWKATR